MSPDLVAALERGALVVTSTRRLAQALARAYDRQQRMAGRAAWPAPALLPWPVFVDDLHRVAQEAGLDVPARRLAPAQEAWLWRSIIGRDAARPPLADEGSLARMAAEAFRIVYAHGEGGESWRGFGAQGAEGEAFARWAEAFLREVDHRGASDSSRRADRVASVAARLPRVQGLEVLLAGNPEPDAQARRLVDALRAAGASVAPAPVEDGPVPAPVVHVARSPREEWVHALRWARSKVEADPHARVGIAMPDLARHRVELEALCELHLAGDNLLPGREARARPFEIAVARPLATLPMVALALDLIAWPHRPLERSRAALALRSPWLPGSAGEIAARANLEHDWLEDAVARVGWAELLRGLRPGATSWDRDPPGDLATAWQRAQRGVALPSRASPREWARCWREWLEALGWARGARPLSSDEYQTRLAFHEALAEFARLDAITPALSAAEALSALRELAGERRFQPQSLEPPIWLVSLQDAPGLELDGLWVCGLTATAWPRAAEPHPLLPISWQRARAVPHASAARELDYARQLTAELGRAASQVVFSYAQQSNDHRVLPSPLLQAWLPARPLPEPEADAVAIAFRQRPKLDAVDDARAPPIPPGAPLRGGAGLVQAQSDCPFQATAKYRLRAREWPSPPLGLDAAERGILIHGALASLFMQVPDHARLAATSDARIAAMVDRAFDEALQGLRRRDDRTRHRLEALPPVVRAAEAQRIRGRIAAWLEIERARPAFTVIERECKVTVAAGGHSLEARIDRVDRLADGSLAVIDYKSGRASAPGYWLEARPQGLQLAVYARAVREALATPVAAMAYAQLRAGRLAAIGIARDPAQWPGLEPGRLEGVSYDEAAEAMEATVDALASAFAAGDAAVTPRDRKACGFCRLEPLCRIRPRSRELVEEERADAGDAA